MITHSYIVPLSYGQRMVAREFVRSILENYDRNSLVGCVLFVNNNPYSLCSYLFLNFESKGETFEDWLKENHPDHSAIYSYLFDDLMSSLPSKSFNVASFSDPNDGLLDIVMSGDANEIYLFPDKDRMNKVFGSPVTASNFSVFLSHSSKDKPYVDNVFKFLHSSGIRAWYDRYQISPGDSITSKINDGLRKSRIGILFISKNFLNNEQGWPIREANYFFQTTINDPSKKFIVVNLGLNHSNLPPLLQDHLYINGEEVNATELLINAIKAAL